MEHGVLASVLCFLVYVTFTRAVMQVAGRTQTVTNDAEFVAALGNPAIDIIQMLEDIYLKETSGAWSPYQPVLQTTNLTVTGCNTSVCSEQIWRVLDLGYLSGLILMDNNVTVRLEQLILANVRKPAGVGLDLFLGREGSAVVFEDGLGYRLACSPSTYQTQALQTSPATTNASSKGVNVIPSFCWRGTCYPNTLHYERYSSKIAPVNTENSLTNYGRDYGFNFTIINSTRLCVSYWPLDCLNRMTSDQCNEYYTDQALEAMQPAPAPSASPAVIVAVPVALGVIALLTLGLVVVLVRRRRHADRRAAAAQGKAMQQDEESGEGSGGSSFMGPLNLGNSTVKQPDGAWQLLARHTAPNTDIKEQSDDDIQLGILLGAGSSGRVYKGRWRGKDVAIKVLQHDASTATAVTNETDLMMGFDHPNIVRAFHVVSWRRCSSQQPPKGRSHAHGSTSELHHKSDPRSSSEPTKGPSCTFSPASSAVVNSGAVLSGPEGAGSGKLEYVVAQGSGDAAGHALWSKHSSGASTRQRSGTTLNPGVIHSGAAVLDPSGVALIPSGATLNPSGATLNLSSATLNPSGMLNPSGATLHSGPAAAARSDASLPLVVLHAAQERHTGSSTSHAAAEAAAAAAAAAETPKAAAAAAAAAASAAEDAWEDIESRANLDDLAQTWLVQEFCDGGTLADAVRAGRIRGTDGKPQMAKVLVRLHDVACGMRYLHARNVIHRDLKANNVLLMSDLASPFGQRAKVADFGLSATLRPGQTHHSTRTMGTISHMAPELLRAGKQSPAADVYAFGIVMWEVVTGRSPFGNAHYGEVFERVAILGERPALDDQLGPALGEEYLLLMHACWNGDPVLRPSFEKVVSALEMLLEACQAGADAHMGDNYIASFSAALAVMPPANEPATGKAAKGEAGKEAANGGRGAPGGRTATTHAFDGEWDL